MMLNKDLLQILVCPKCQAQLSLQNKQLNCQVCKLAYRIEDSIPVLLIDEAIKIK